MNVGGAILGGALGGLLGGAVWVGVGYATGYELGFLAWGVGLTCGIGVAMGTKGHAGTEGGIIAGAFALLSILAAKYVLVGMFLNNLVSEAVAEVQSSPTIENNNFWVGYIADRIISDRMEAGEEINWPEYEWDSDDEDLDFDEEDGGEVVIDPAEYPADIWAQAQSQWNGFDIEQRQEFRKAAIQLMAADLEDGGAEMGIATAIVFLISCFRPMSLVFLGLAIATAFKVARDSRPAGVNEFGGVEEAFQPAPVNGGFPAMPSGQASVATARPGMTAANPPQTRPGMATSNPPQARPQGMPSQTQPNTPRPAANQPRPAAKPAPNKPDDGDQTWVPPWMRSQ